MHIPVQLSLSQISCVTSTHHCFNFPCIRKTTTRPYLNIHVGLHSNNQSKNIAPSVGNIQCLDTKPSSLRSGNPSQQCVFNFQVLLFVQNYKTHATRLQCIFNKSLAFFTSRTSLILLTACLQLLFPYYKPTILYRTVTFQTKAVDFIESIIITIMIIIIISLPYNREMILQPSVME